MPFDNKFLVLIAIFFVLACIFTYYWICYDTVETTKPIKPKPISLQTILIDSSGEFPDARIVSPITINKTMFIYRDKSAKVTENDVSLLTILIDGKKTKQILLTGNLTLELEYENLNVYRFNYKHKKINISTTTDDVRVTQRTLDSVTLPTLKMEIKNDKVIRDMLNAKLID